MLIVQILLRVHVSVGILSAQKGGVDIEIDTLEYQQTEKIETELKDVDRIRIRKVYACCPG